MNYIQPFLSPVKILKYCIKDKNAAEGLNDIILLLQGYLKTLVFENSVFTFLWNSRLNCSWQNLPKSRPKATVSNRKKWKSFPWGKIIFTLHKWYKLCSFRWKIWIKPLGQIYGKGVCWNWGEMLHLPRKATGSVFSLTNSPGLPVMVQTFSQLLPLSRKAKQSKGKRSRSSGLCFKPVTNFQCGFRYLIEYNLFWSLVSSSEPGLNKGILERDFRNEFHQGFLWEFSVGCMLDGRHPWENIFPVSAGDQTRGLMRTWQMLYYWGTPLALGTLEMAVAIHTHGPTFHLKIWFLIPALKYLKGSSTELRTGDLFLYFVSTKEHLNINSVGSINATC